MVTWPWRFMATPARPIERIRRATALLFGVRRQAMRDAALDGFAGPTIPRQSGVALRLPPHSISSWHSSFVIRAFLDLQPLPDSGLHPAVRSGQTDQLCG